MARTRSTRSRVAQPLEEPGTSGYEADDAPPHLRPSGRQTATGGHRRRAREEDEPEERQGRGFLSRLLAGMFGALALAAGAAGASWPQLQATWDAILADATFPLWQGYGVVAALALGGALVIGIIAALHDRSLWKCLLIGAAWAALVRLGLGYHAEQVPLPQGVGHDNVVAGLAMTRAALAPTNDIARRLSLELERQTDESQAALLQRDEQIGSLSAQRDEAATALAAAREAADAAATARDALETRRGELQRQVDATRTELADARESISTLETEGEELEQRVATLRNDLEAATALADAATEAKQRLETDLAAARQKAEAASKALERAQADAAALKTLRTAE